MGCKKKRIYSNPRRQHNITLVYIGKYSNTIPGIAKAITAAAKKKSCEVLGIWKKAIINNLYWCVCSTTRKYYVDVNVHPSPVPTRGAS